MARALQREPEGPPPDGYFFGCVTEILVDPDYQGRGVGRELMERLWKASPTSIFLGAQPENEEFFEKLGYEESLASYQKRKPRPKRGDGNSGGQTPNISDRDE
ncbi:MAG: GNAT family N-acetyltransferase [Persicimonas sp.]